MLHTLTLAATLACVSAQDPAGGWLGYARALPPGGIPGQRLTKISARWKNNAAPRRSSSFYSPWFGIDTSDNLNLLQPVNPWLGNEWQIYNEYFQVRSLSFSRFYRAPHIESVYAAEVSPFFLSYFHFFPLFLPFSGAPSTTRTAPRTRSTPATNFLAPSRTTLLQTPTMFITTLAMGGRCTCPSKSKRAKTGATKTTASHTSFSRRMLHVRIIPRMR
jgi:hypothetical protein